LNAVTFLSPVTEEIKLVEERMRTQANNSHADLRAAVEHLLAAGGKRIRPTLGLLVGNMLDAPLEKLITLGAAVELLHTATLVHDDLIDGARVRRGRAAPLADWPLVRLIDALQKLCHDLMCVRAEGAPRYFSAAQLSPLIQPQAPDWPALANWAKALTRAARHAEHPWHAGLRSEALVGQGARLWQTPRSRQALPVDPLDTLDAR